MFRGVHWSDDILNHENVGFWHYLQPAYNVMGFISCAGTNFLLRSAPFASAGGYLPLWCDVECTITGMDPLAGLTSSSNRHMACLDGRTLCMMRLQCEHERQHCMYAEWHDSCCYLHHGCIFCHSSPTPYSPLSTFLLLVDCGGNANEQACITLLQQLQPHLHLTTNLAHPFSLSIVERMPMHRHA